MIPEFEPPIESQLGDELVTELNEVLGARAIAVRRFMPLFERADLEELKVTVYLDAGEDTIVGRGIDQREISVGIAIQQAVPHAESDVSGETIFDGVDNIEFSDSILALATELRALWRPKSPLNSAGQLRDKTIVGCVFRDLEQDHLYEPNHLLTKGVMTVCFAVMYTHAITAAKDDDE